METDGSLTPSEALGRARETTTTVRRSGRWRVIGWWVLAAFMTVQLLGDEVFPEFLDRWSLVMLGGTMLILAALALFARVFDRRSARFELWFIAATLLAAIASVALYEWVLPDGVTVWTYLVGSTPLLVCAVVTVRILRR